jgi:hypothetical protein
MTVQDWETLRARKVARLDSGWELEPASALAAMAAHREYWRPRVVRVLLLAESHVLTRESERAAQVRLGPFAEVLAGASTIDNRSPIPHDLVSLAVENNKHDVVR